MLSLIYSFTAMTNSLTMRAAASIATLVAALGWLRLLLLLLAVVTALFAPAAETRTVITWPLIVPTLIAPAIAPIVMMVVMFDLLMAKVLSAGEHNAAKRNRARTIMYADAFAIAALLLAYLPFFMALGR